MSRGLTTTGSRQEIPASILSYVTVSSCPQPWPVRQGACVFVTHRINGDAEMTGREAVVRVPVNTL